jgi:cytochrome c5
MLKGEWIRNPQVITDKYVEDGKIVYGEMKSRCRGQGSKGAPETGAKPISLSWTRG